MNNMAPKVTICVVTYNQETLIQQCLESLISQVTNFKFEIIVSDDASTDNTPNIIQQYADKYPDIIKPILHKKNLGALENFIFVHNQATGEYISHMDGDDYSLAGKLQAQADFLDAHDDCNIVWHRVKILFSDSNTLYDDLIQYNVLPKEGFTRADILQFITIGVNSSKMYRAYKEEMVMPNFEVVDYFKNVEEVQNKKAYFVNDNFYGVYRAGIGIASSGSATRILLCKSFLHFAKKYPEYKDRINAATLLYFIVDLKNKRSTAKDFFIVWLKTFHYKSIYLIYKNRNIIKMFRLPKNH